MLSASECDTAPRYLVPAARPLQSTTTFSVAPCTADAGAEVIARLLLPGVAEKDHENSV